MSAIDIIAQKRESLAGRSHIHTMIEFYNVRTFAFLRHMRDFFTLVAFTHACEATEPRDKVYALLGLVKGDYASQIVIDYRKNIKDVHRNALVLASTYHQDLKLLALCDSASEPSWIPDLEQIQHLRPMTDGRAALCSAENAHAFTTEQLRLQGVRCDYIVELIGPKKGEYGERQLQSIIIMAARRYLGLDPQTWTLEKIQQFSQMLHINDTFIHPPYIHKMQTLLAEQASSGSDTLDATLIYLTHYIHHRCIYLTRMGYIMIGPRDCLPGDPVVVFLGCHLPMVLRAIENGEYKLKGPCSHPALLCSEAVLGKMPKGWRLRMTQRLGNPLFENAVGDQQHLDPRLNDIPLPDEWELRWRDDGTPFFYTAKEDRWTNFDPRLTLESLRGRGVRVDDYVLR